MLEELVLLLYQLVSSIIPSVHNDLPERMGGAGLSLAIAARAIPDLISSDSQVLRQAGETVASAKQYSRSAGLARRIPLLLHSCCTWEKSRVCRLSLANYCVSVRDLVKMFGSYNGEPCNIMDLATVPPQCVPILTYLRDLYTVKFRLAQEVSESSSS